MVAREILNLYYYIRRLLHNGKCFASISYIYFELTFIFNTGNYLAENFTAKNLFSVTRKRNVDVMF